jgi:hypothetical protein
MARLPEEASNPNAADPTVAASEGQSRKTFGPASEAPGGRPHPNVEPIPPNPSPTESLRPTAGGTLSQPPQQGCTIDYVPGGGSPLNAGESEVERAALCFGVMS